MSTRLLPALLLAGLCGTASVSAASAQHFLIVPGRSIGRTTLGPNGSSALERLPRPTAEDNGMMQSYLVWVSRTSGHADTLFIHTTANGAYGNVKPVDGVTIDTIRITSPQFHTRNGISTVSTLAQVRRRFPTARADHFAPQVYSDARHGVAFEFTQPVSPASRCIAISIQLPGGGHAVTAQSEVDSLLKDAK